MFFTLLLTLGLGAVARAQCQAENLLNYEEGLPLMEDQNLCLPQSEGDWTFSMGTALAVLPIPMEEGGYGTGGYFYIFDHTCHTRGIYRLPSCGTPFTIQENFLQHVLTVDAIFMDIGDPYFSMYYGDGQYVTQNNQCGCTKSASVGSGTAECKCGFPVDGTLNAKREIEAPVKRSVNFWI